MDGIVGTILGTIGSVLEKVIPDTNKRKEVIQEVTQELYNKFNLDIKSAINETNIFSKKAKVILEKIINDLNKPQ